MDLFLLLCWILFVRASAAASHYTCSSPLVSLLPQSAFQSSSQLTFSSAAHNAKVNGRGGSGGWSPLRLDPEPWLQLDLREQVEVTAVATGGRSASSDWVRRYLLLHSDTGRRWTEYRREDGGRMFMGNVNSDSMVQVKLSPSLRTRFLRFIPLDWNPSGWIGLRVELYGCSHKSDVVDFDGHSSLLYRFNQKSMSTVKDVISLRFKSRQAEGVLVHGEGRTGDYVTLELHRGHLRLYINLDDTRLPLSSSPAAVTLGSLLDDQLWHHVTFERFSRQLNVSVDSHTQHFTTRGSGESLELDYELSFGGIPLPGKPGTFLRRNFDGCIKNLYYNSINIIDLAKRRKPQIYTVGNLTFSCTRPSPLAVTFISSSGSFLSLPSPSAILGGFSVRFQFRTWTTDGLLLSARLNRENQRINLWIRDNRLTLSINEGRAMEISAGQRVNDGLWHSVSVDTRDLRVSLTLDNEPASSLQRWEQLEVQGGFYFGGCPPAGCPSLTPSFQGCMRLISINNQHIDLQRVQQSMLGVYSQLQFDTCSIRDRCVPNLCEHGGVCLQTWSSFSCDCSDTGHSGAVCHRPLAEASCEAYRLTGASSGFYSIDPDGSGPLEPTKVYCNMTDDGVWTVVHHNVSTHVRVHGSSMQNPHVMTFDYSSTPKQLHAIISQSEHCHQEVIYRCRKSRLFDYKDGRPLAWWLDGGGQRQSYWGGVARGVQQCPCSVEGNCMDRNYLCNCDADLLSWTRDSGVLSSKNHLPVSAVVIGDTHRPGSEAVYTIGPLTCYGDRWTFNTASFLEESSSLVFPALQAELSSDFSFSFRTRAAAGVFLEVLGHQHFIRLELSSPSVVSLSFHFGDGLMVVALTSPLVLNDGQWHLVRAELNVKEAWLQVDQLSPRLLEAPSDVQRRLRLNGQLVVGGSWSRLRGFLGCLRSLNINGVLVDLEEKARTAPGTSSGCPGHCSTPSRLCHNGGRCIETSDGYSCDCSNSAYGGPTCREEVSVWMHRESSLSFFLQDSFNRSFGERWRASEDAEFSFITSQSPAHLLTISTFSQQYISVILSTDGSLQIWYQLQTGGHPDVFSPIISSLSDGRVHRIRVQREGSRLDVQVDHDVFSRLLLSSDSELVSPRSLTVGKILRGEVFSEDLVHAASEGFVGCLSSVRFNHVAPLKVALLNRGSSFVTIRGSLVQSNCGSLTDSITSNNLMGSSHDDSPLADEEKNQDGDPRSDVAVITGVLTAVIFITACILAVVTRLLYLRQVEKNEDSKAEKEYHHSRETPTGPKLDHHIMETPFRPEIHLHNMETPSEPKLHPQSLETPSGLKLHPHNTETPSRPRLHLNDMETPTRLEPHPYSRDSPIRPKLHLFKPVRDNIKEYYI